ncbi:MAG TPA: TonB-dependent receptor [Bacteroidales bacterium]|nr:TonB-dependent receptor [Bacteroidales bacterium]
MMKKIIVFSIIVLWIIQVSAQGKISGLVMDEQTGNILPVATVKILELNMVTTSDKEGAYVFKYIQPGKYHLAFTYVGYKNDTVQVTMGKKSDRYIITKLTKAVIDISEVTVIASRTEKGFRVPASMDVITKKQLQELPVVSVDDALVLVSGLNASRNYGIYNKTGDVTLRGLNRNIYSLILLDGVPYSLFDGSANLWNKLYTEKIDDIQIVKGANSALYGSNAMSGVICINTYKPEKSFEARAKVFFGTYNTQGGNLVVGGNRSKNDRGFYWSVNGFYRKSGGYIMAPDSLRTPYDVKTYVMEYNALAKTGYQFGKGHNIEVEYEYSSDKRGTGSKFFEEQGSYNHYRTHFTRLSYNRVHDNHEIHANVFFKKEGYIKQNESIKKNTGLYTFYNTDTDTHDEGLWFSYTTRTIKNNVLTVGTDVKSGAVYSNDIYHTSVDTIENNGKMDFFGVFIQDQLSLLKDKFVILAALRADLVHFYGGIFHIYSPTLATSFLYDYQGDFKAKSWFALSPKAGFKYIFNENFNIYALYSWGFRPPQINDLSRTGDVNKGFKLANPGLKPERIQSVELGAGLRPAKWLLIQPIVFYSKGIDFQYFVATGDSVYTSGVNMKPVIKRQNVGRVNIAGFELKTSISFTKNMKLTTCYSYNYSVIGKYLPGTVVTTDLTGRDLIEVPRNLFSGIYTWNNRIITATLTAKFIDKEWVDDENTIRLDSYWTFDARIQRMFYNKINFALTCQNILNKRFVDSKGYLSPGRYFLFELSFNW